jgi:hypothetical protein
VLAACQPMRTSDYAPESVPKPRGTVVLDLGRRYAVVISGTGVNAREEPDPAARQIASYGFATVVSTTTEGSGADGKTWRRVGNRGWAPREGLLVFSTIGDASKLATELRIFAPRDLRRLIQVRDGPRRPPTPTAAATPGAPAKAPAKPVPPTATARPPTATPTPNRTTVPSAAGGPEPLYGVVLRPETRLFEQPGAQPSSRAPLEAGAVVAAVDQVVGADGQQWLKLDSNLWLSPERVSLHASPAEAAAVAYDVTMEWLAPGVEVHPDVAPALWVVQREAETRYLAEVIRDGKVPIRVEKLADPGPLALYSFRDRAITISERAVGLDVRALAAYLVHEATHAWEHQQGLTLPVGATAACFEAELRAFRNQARLWEIFHGPEGKGEPGSTAERELNEIQQMLKQDPEQLKLRLVRLYGDQCGYHGPQPAVATATPPAATPKPVSKPVATPKPKVATP